MFDERLLYTVAILGPKTANLKKGKLNKSFRIVEIE